MGKVISNAVIRRMPRYYRYLGELLDNNIERISSNELSRIMNVTASQIRQDLNNFGGFGQQGYGYNVQYLYEEIGKILGLDETHNIIIIGAGNLGMALANYGNFANYGLNIISLFDKLENFLKKLLYIKNGEINFDYSYFDIFAKMSNHNIKNYFHNIYLSKHENEKNNQNNQINAIQKKEKEKSLIDSISLKIVEPFIEVLTINEIKNNYKAIQSSIKLKKQFIEELIRNDINNWIEVIKKYKNELSIKYHVKYEEAKNQKQKVRRKISIYDNINNKRFSRQSINNMKIG